ncbi:hypothetical protein [Lysinibacillus sp. LZ02]
MTLEEDYHNAIDDLEHTGKREVDQDLFTKSELDELLPLAKQALQESGD